MHLYSSNLITGISTKVVTSKITNGSLQITPILYPCCITILNGFKPPKIIFVVNIAYNCFDSGQIY